MTSNRTPARLFASFSPGTRIETDIHGLRPGCLVQGRRLNLFFAPCLGSPAYSLFLLPPFATAIQPYSLGSASDAVFGLEQQLVYSVAADRLYEATSLLETAH